MPRGIISKLLPVSSSDSVSIYQSFVGLPRTPKFCLPRGRGIELPAFAFCMISHDYGVVTDFFGNEFQTRDLKSFREQRVASRIQV